MRTRPERRFSQEFKLAALARMAAGENVSALARALGVKRRLRPRPLTHFCC